MKPKKSVKKRKRKQSTWQKILQRDLQLSELQLFNDTVSSRMVQEAFILERKRKPGDYIT